MAYCASGYRSSILIQAWARIGLPSRIARAVECAYAIWLYCDVRLIDAGASIG